MKAEKSIDWFTQGVLFLSLVVCLAASSASASVTIDWGAPTTNADGTPCTDLAGYKIYYDTDGPGGPYNGSGLPQGDSPITVPLSELADPAAPTLTLVGLVSGATYSMVVTAYDTSGNESGYSNELNPTETETDSDDDRLSDPLEASYGLDLASSDSDADGIGDLAEWGTSEFPADTDFDGVVDALDTDSDNDGTPDLDEDSVDSDLDGTPDRLDAKTATMATTHGNMSVVLNHISGSLAQTRFIATVASGSGHPDVEFPYGGVEYQITGLSAGETVLVTIIMADVLPANAEYWKYDPVHGFQKIASQTSGREISFNLRDGGAGDADGSANGVIVDPGYVGVPLPANPVTSSSGGGGGGCALARDSGALPDVFFFLFPLVLVLILKSRSERRKPGIG